MVDKLIVNCTTGERRTEPLTDDEVAGLEAAAQEVADREAAALAEEEEWRDAIRNASSLGDLKKVLAGDSGAPGQAARDRGRPST